MSEELLPNGGQAHNFIAHLETLRAQPTLANEETAQRDSTSGEYDRHFPIGPGQTILDLGACLGHFSEYCLNKMNGTGKVIAFEPHPVNYERMSRRLAGHPNFFAVNACASSRNTLGTFWTNPLNCGGHCLYDRGDDQRGYPLPTLIADIGPWCAAYGIKPDFVKIDAEFSEYEILESLLREEFRPTIAVEIHDENMCNSCGNILVLHHYRVTPWPLRVGVNHALV